MLSYSRRIKIHALRGHKPTGYAETVAERGQNGTDIHHLSDLRAARARTGTVAPKKRPRAARAHAHRRRQNSARAGPAACARASVACRRLAAAPVIGPWITVTGTIGNGLRDGERVERGVPYRRPAERTGA